MAAKYRKVDPRLWHDEKFHALSPSDKLITVYVLTSSQVNRIGIFPFSQAMAAEDLGMKDETFRERFRNVCQTFNWGWDSTPRVLYLRTWWKYNQPENINVFKGCLADLHDIPLSPLILEFFKNNRYLQKTFAEHMANVSETFRERYPIQEQDQEQEQKQNNSPLPPKGDDETKNDTEKGQDKNKAKCPESLNTPEFHRAWADWVSFRKELKKPLTKLSVERQLKDLAKEGVYVAIKTIEESIRNGYQGLFPDRIKQKQFDIVEYAGSSPVLDMDSLPPPPPPPPWDEEHPSPKMKPKEIPDAGSKPDNAPVIPQP